MRALSGAGHHRVSTKLRLVFRAIVMSLSACNESSEQQAEGGADVGNTRRTSPPPAATLDSYVDWCEAGPPEILTDAACNNYYYVPCGLPAGDVVDDAGVMNRCDQVCADGGDDRCALLYPPIPDMLVDAGLFDAAGSTDAGVFVLCACTGSSGRRPSGLVVPPVRARDVIGYHFARMAQLEAASVPAFERLHSELRDLGASPALLERVRRAIRDERRHASVASRAAHRFGAFPMPPRVGAFRARGVEAMARENIVEGCVRETFGALVATWQARHAADAAIRRTMTRIARDETRHAELSFQVAELLDARLDARARSRVDRARRRAILELESACFDTPVTLVRVAGIPPASVARRLARALFDQCAASAAISASTRAREYLRRLRTSAASAIAIAPNAPRDGAPATPHPHPPLSPIGVSPAVPVM